MPERMPNYANRKVLVSKALEHWRRILSFGLPAVLTPVIMLLPVPTSFCCMYATAMLDVLFLLNALPSTMIALMPAFLIPVFGPMSTGDVAAVYFAKNQLFFLGCLSIAAAFYESTLSRRCALLVLTKIGSDGRRVMSFVVLCTVLSGYFFNTYLTSLLMLPVVDSLSDEICQVLLDPSLKDVHVTTQDDHEGASPPEILEFMARSGTMTNVAAPTPSPTGQREQDDVSSQFVTAENVLLVSDQSPMFLQPNKGYTLVADEKSHILKYRIKLRKILLTGLLYGATIGQTATSQTPVYEELMEYMEVKYPLYHELGKFTYAFYSLPTVIACTLFLWCNLFRRITAERSRVRMEEKKLPQNIFHNRYQVGGPWTFGEAATLVISFLVLLCAAMPKELVAWFFGNRDVSSLTLVMSLAILLHALPAYPCGGTSDDTAAILPWEVAKDRIPWSCVLLVGCGAINATYFVRSGMDDLMKQMMQQVSGWPSWAILVITCLLVCFMAECTNNTKGIGFLLHTLDRQAEEQKVNPLKLMLPASRLSIATFMIAMSNNSNALLKDYGGLSTLEMVSLGGQLHLLFVGLELVTVLTVGTAMFKLNVYPYWASSHNTTAIPTYYTNWTYAWPSGTPGDLANWTTV
ncbi:solute carrier family 13 member 1-like isoform X2 [Ornithodoros turicata]|uniref:solute carrier family 13 member 1-like isoform X2 n=1 Tax=Ornithodoros turicata TaxID=34597 RepID=UPI003139540F